MNIHAIEEIKDTATGSRPVLAIRLGRGRTGGTTVLRGRDVRYRTPPAQIRTSGIPAYGSHLG